MALILDGKALSAKIRESLKEEVAALAAGGTVPGLAVVLVGDDPASKIYVNNKKKGCEKLGIHSEEYLLAASITQRELLELVDMLNKKPDIDGVLVQLPLPGHIDERAVIRAIAPDKDVDAFHPENVGRMVAGDPLFLPCTPAGVMELLREAGVSPAGKECVVVGRSNIVGKPQAMLLLHEHGTVTICHSKTKNLAEVCARADILVAAVGKPRLITAGMVKEGAVVIDVGMNRLPDGSLCGDVDFDAVEPKASCITPVPGGVGPMTITMLLKNTVKAAALRAKKKGR